MMSVLGTIATELNKIGVPYEFMEWTDPVQYPYFVGEYSEVPPTAEDGGKEATLMLTGTTNTNDHNLGRHTVCSNLITLKFVVKSHRDISFMFS
jgi:hypothetical protein